MDNQQTFVAYVTGKRSGRGRFTVKALSAAEAREIFETRGFAVRRVISTQQELFCKLGLIAVCIGISAIAVMNHLGVLPFTVL